MDELSTNDADTNIQKIDLSALGLTSNESKAYESLIMLGKASAAQISKYSKIPYGRIYTVLDSLESKGLVRIIPEDTKKYQPANPEDLEKYVQEKHKRLNEIQEKLKTYKSIYKEHNVDAVQIVFGKHNFHKLANQMIIAQEYSYSIKYTFGMHPEFIRETQGYIKRKIDYKVLGRIDTETEDNVEKWKKIDSRIKPVPNEGVAISIMDDKEMLIGLIKSNTTMLIKDQAFIKLMKELFKSYYETH